MSRYLLDTRVFLWLQTTPDRLRRDVVDQLADERNEVLLSSASSWEIAIKHGLGTLQLPDPPDRYVPAALHRSGIQPVPIGHPEALAVAALPMHHRDPFDRLIIAQADVLDATIVTVDAAFDEYDVEILDPR